MRAIFKVSMVAAAALAVSACGSKTETNIDNATVTDLNATDEMGMTDNMTTVDGTMGNMDNGMATATNTMGDAANTMSDSANTMSETANKM